MDMILDENIKLDAVTRIAFGKRAAKQLRNQNKIPITACSKETGSLSLLIDYSSYRKITPKLKPGKFITLNVDDGTSYKTLIRIINKDPVSDLPIHIEFYVVNDENKIKVHVPIEIVNSHLCYALKSGGFLNLVNRKICVYCKPHDLPNTLPIDIKDSVVGTSIRISDFTFPPNVKCMLDPNTTVITIAGKKVAKSKDASEGAATAEKGEADKSKKDDKKAKK